MTISLNKIITWKWSFLWIFYKQSLPISILENLPPFIHVLNRSEFMSSFLRQLLSVGSDMTCKTFCWIFKVSWYKKSGLVYLTTLLRRDAFDPDPIRHVLEVPQFQAFKLRDPQTSTVSSSSLSKKPESSTTIMAHDKKFFSFKLCESLNYLVFVTTWSVRRGWAFWSFCPNPTW